MKRVVEEFEAGNVGCGDRARDRFLPLRARDRAMEFKVQIEGGRRGLYEDENAQVQDVLFDQRFSRGLGAVSGGPSCPSLREAHCDLEG